MSKERVTETKRALEDKGYSLARVGKEEKRHRSSVSRCLRSPDAHPGIRDRITKILGSTDWMKEGEAAA